MSGPSARIVLEAIESESEEPLSIEEVHEDGEAVVLIGRSRNGARVGRRFVVRDGTIVVDEPHPDPASALRRAGLDGSTGPEVALVRRHYEAFNRDDVEAILATLHPEVEIVGSDERGGGEPERYRGRVEATSFFSEIKQLVAENDVVVLSLEARPGRVVASVRLRGTMRATERSGSLPAVHIFTIADGLIAKIETYRPDWRSEAEATDRLD